MALPATDNFNRANQNPIAGNWSVVTGWANAQLLSNAVQNLGGAGAAIYWNGDIFDNNQYSQIKVTGDFRGGAIVRVNGNVFYLWYYAGANVMRYYRVTGVEAYTQLGSDISVTVNTNSILKLEISGSTLTGYVDGVAQVTKTDTNIVAGSAGIHFNGTAQIWDDWEGGNLVTLGKFAPVNKLRPRIFAPGLAR